MISGVAEAFMQVHFFNSEAMLYKSSHDMESASKLQTSFIQCDRERHEVLFDNTLLFMKLPKVHLNGTVLLTFSQQ